MTLALYEVGRAGRQCVVAAPTRIHAVEDAELHLGGRPEAIRRIGTAAADIARGIVVAAGPRVTDQQAAGPAVIAAALRALGSPPNASRHRLSFLARVAAWSVLRDLGKLSYPQIGALTGHHHSTVMHALEAIPRVADDERFRAAHAAAERAYKDATS